MGVGYLWFQNYTLQVEVHRLASNLSAADSKIEKLTHHSFVPKTIGPKDYLALASVYIQNGEDAVRAHDCKRARKEYGFAQLATEKAMAQGMTGQRAELHTVSQQVVHLADEIKQLADAIRG